MEREQQIEILIGGVGVVIAALTLFGSHSSGTSANPDTGYSSGSGISSSALSSETNSYNADAAAVAEGITSAESAVTQAGLASRTAAIQAYTSTSENQLSTLENAVTQQASIADSTSANEYAEQINGITSAYESAETTASNAYATYVGGAVSEANEAVAANAATNQTALTTTAQEYETELQTQLARDQSNNGVTQQKIADTPSFGTTFSQILGSIGSAASGVFGIGGLSSLFGGGGNSTAAGGGETYQQEFGNAPAQGQPGSPFFGGTTAPNLSVPTLSNNPTVSAGSSLQYGGL